MRSGFYIRKTTLARQLNYLKKGIYIILGLLIGGFISIALMIDANGFKMVSPEEQIDEVKYNQRLVEAGKPSNDFMMEQLDKVNRMILAEDAKETYFITDKKLDAYVDSQVIVYGRANPMYYSSTIATIPEEVPEEEQEENTKTPFGEGFLSGYDINTGKLVSKPIGYIAEAFENDAVLPVAAKYFGLSSGFGIRTNPLNSGLESFHVGLDISGEKINGQEVYSVLNGSVSLVSTNDILGNHIVVNHGGFNTVYAHLEGYARNIEEGTNVNAGSVLGYVGSTGMSTGPHLHFEIEESGIKFNPEYFLGLVEGFPTESKRGYWPDATN